MKLIKNGLLSMVMLTGLLGSQWSWAQNYRLVNVARNFNFVRPVEVIAGPGGMQRLFVVNQRGIIYSLPDTLNAPRVDTALNISARVVAGGEMGLLGIAFPPDFDQNQRLIFHYTDQVGQRRNVISEFTALPGSTTRFDPASERIIMTINQPLANHNGGKIAFGPDGYLYIGIGDGGGAGDPSNFGQNRSSLLGKVLRIDINGTQGTLNYRIPSDNPFVGNTQGWREEIFAWGLRNPWKFNFDDSTGKIWLADVGQNLKEEIDIIESGKNYGWRIVEGNSCYNPSTNCNRAGLEPPVFEYGQTQGDRSVTGGYVYRGTAFPTWQGGYVYGDYVSGRIWILRQDPVSQAWVNTLLGREATSTLSSFGQDERGELYICNHTSGVVSRMVPLVTSLAKPNNLGGLTLAPNPAKQSVNLRFMAPVSGEYKVLVRDMLGREQKLAQDVWQLGAGNQSVQVALPKLIPSVYNLYVVQGNNTWVQRLVIE